MELRVGDVYPYQLCYIYNTLCARRKVNGFAFQRGDTWKPVSS